MSSRALRRLQNMNSKESYENSANKEDSNSGSSGEETEDKEIKLPVKKCNRFDLLIGASLSESEAKEDDGMIDNEEKKSPNNKQQTEYASGARKKKKKRKRKGHNKYPASSEDQMDFDQDEVERSVQEVNAILGEARLQSTSVGEIQNNGGKNLLTVEHKYLNPQNEMKRIFGPKVVQSNETNRRRNARHGASSRVGRGTWIIQGQSQWQQLSKPGISMVLVESTPTYHVFKFQHNSAYQQIQFKFLTAVESVNPDKLLNLLHSDPFHVDTLLQVAEIFRLADDSAMSAQLIERAIYVLESVSHPLFNLTQCNSRLQFKQQENRCLFIALFRHILNVGMKGCYRTALELCKLLLSLSPDDDPMAVSLMLDFYALRSQEYAWLVALYDLYEPTKNLSMLPNFAFSVPLALFHLSESECGLSAATNDRVERGRKSVLYNNLGSSKELRQRADEMLLRAIIMFPVSIKLLLDKCGVQSDYNFAESTYFGPEAEEGMSKGLSQIVKLFVGRNFHVWKEPAAMAWLEEIFKEAVKSVARNDPSVAECEEKRKVRYQGTPTAIYRHIMIAEVQDATVALPPLLSSGPVMSYDPLPPPNSVSDYVRPSPPPTPSASSSTILESFFRGILPNYDPQRDALEEPVEAEAGTNETAELRASVNTLLEAIRNLFINITTNEVAGDEASGEDEAGNWN